MSADNREPCKSCPYRRDAKLEHWHPSEFERLLRNDSDPMGGSVFGCHGEAKKDPKERETCIGWLLDQRRRGVPCIAFRLLIIFNRDAMAQFEESRAPEGVSLYDTIEEMCAANGVDIF